jgi:hypothetical protein
VGSDLFLDDKQVSHGMFTVELDFGAGAFNGNNRYLDIAIREGSSTGGYQEMSPRVKLTFAPYSIYSLKPWEKTSGGIFL